MAGGTDSGSEDEHADPAEPNGGDHVPGELNTGGVDSEADDDDDDIPQINGGDAAATLSATAPALAPVVAPAATPLATAPSSKPAAKPAANKPSGKANGKPGIAKLAPSKPGPKAAAAKPAAKPAAKAGAKAGAKPATKPSGAPASASVAKPAAKSGMSVAKSTGKATGKATTPKTTKVSTPAPPPATAPAASAPAVSDTPVVPAVFVAPDAPVEAEAGANNADDVLGNSEDEMLDDAGDESTFTTGLPLRIIHAPPTSYPGTIDVVQEGNDARMAPPLSAPVPELVDIPSVIDAAVSDNIYLVKSERAAKFATVTISEGSGHHRIPPDSRPFDITVSEYNNKSTQPKGAETGKRKDPDTWVKCLLDKEHVMTRMMASVRLVRLAPEVPGDTKIYCNASFAVNIIKDTGMEQAAFDEFISKIPTPNNPDNKPVVLVHQLTHKEMERLYGVTDCGLPSEYDPRNANVQYRVIRQVDHQVNLPDPAWELVGPVKRTRTPAKGGGASARESAKKQRAPTQPNQLTLTSNGGIVRANNPASNGTDPGSALALVAGDEAASSATNAVEYAGETAMRFGGENADGNEPGRHIFNASGTLGVSLAILTCEPNEQITLMKTSDGRYVLVKA